MVEVEAEAELVAVEEAEDVQWVVAEVMEVVTVVEHEDVVGEGGRSEGRAKRRRKRVTIAEQPSMNSSCLLAWQRKVAGT